MSRRKKEKLNKLDKYCPYCGAKLFIIGSTEGGRFPVFCCCNCFLFKGSYVQMQHRALARKQYMEMQSSRFICARCKNTFPSFKHVKHVLVKDYNNTLCGRLYCPECEKAHNKEK